MLYFDGLVIEKKRRKIMTRLFYKMLDVYYIRRSRKINENTNKYRMGGDDITYSLDKMGKNVINRKIAIA